jgi:hypothetical protein
MRQTHKTRQDHGVYNDKDFVENMSKKRREKRSKESGKKVKNQTSGPAQDLITGTWIQEGNMDNPYDDSEDPADFLPFGRLESPRLANGRLTPGALDSRGADSFILYQDTNLNKSLDSEDKIFGSLRTSDLTYEYFTSGKEIPVTYRDIRIDNWEVVLNGPIGNGTLYDTGFPMFDMIITDSSVFS